MVDQKTLELVPGLIGKVNRGKFHGFPAGSLLAGKAIYKDGKVTFNFRYLPPLYESADFPADAITYTVDDARTGERIWPPVR